MSHMQDSILPTPNWRSAASESTRRHILVGTLFKPTPRDAICSHRLLDQSIFLSESSCTRVPRWCSWSKAVQQRHIHLHRRRISQKAHLFSSLKTYLCFLLRLRQGRVWSPPMRTVVEGANQSIIITQLTYTILKFYKVYSRTKIHWRYQNLASGIIIWEAVPKY